MEGFRYKRTQWANKYGTKDLFREYTKCVRMNKSYEMGRYENDHS